MYNDLDMQCVHFDKCGQVVKLCDIEKHEKTCQLPKCENFELCSNFVQKEVKKTVLDFVDFLRV